MSSSNKSNEESMSRIKKIWLHLSKEKLLRCAACELLILKAKDITYDHYTPRSLGGDISFKNGRPMHPRCNRVKGNIPPDIWEKEKWKLLAENGIQTIQDYNIHVDTSEINYVEIDGNVYSVSYYGEISKYNISNSEIQKPVNTQTIQCPKQKKKIKKKKRKPNYKYVRKIYVPSKIKDTIQSSKTYNIGDIVFFEDQKVPNFIKEGIVIGINYNSQEKYIIARTLCNENGKIVSKIMDVKPIDNTMLDKYHIDKNIPLLSLKLNERIKG